jgi:ribonuclease P/MRP protein subunit RPP1
VVDGVEIDVESPQQASGAVGNARSDRTLVAVRGGTDAMNRFAVENEKVDVLAGPMAGPGTVNHVIAKAAVENGVRIEFDLGPVLREQGGERVRAIQGLRKLHDIVTSYDAPYVVSARPDSHLAMRAPRDLAAVAAQLDFDAAWVRAGLREWGELAARNRHVQSEAFVEPGVERGQYDE